MATIWWEAFDGQHNQKWSSLEGTVVATSAGIGDHPTNGVGRCLSLGQNQSRRKVFPSSYTELYSGFYMRPGILSGGLNGYRDGSVEFFFGWETDQVTQMCLAISASTRKMTLYFAPGYITKIAEGSHIFADQTQFFHELRYKMAASGGSIQTWVNGVLDLNFDNADTASTAATTFNGFVLFSPNSGGFPAYYDSIRVNDTTGAEDNGRTGIRHLWGQLPDGDSAVNNAFSRSSGSDGYLLVREQPPDGDTSYVYSTTTGQKQGHTFGPHGLPSNAVVKAVIHEHSMRMVTSGQVKVGQRENAVEVIGSAENLPVDYGIRETRRILRPDGTAWTVPTADNVESLIESVI